MKSTLSFLLSSSEKSEIQDELLLCEEKIDDPYWDSSLRPEHIQIDDRFSWSGYQGRVYFGWTLSGQKVCLKRLLPGVYSPLKEDLAHRLNRISHTAKIYNLGYDQRGYFCIMEEIKGSQLSEVRTNEELLLKTTLEHREQVVLKFIEFYQDCLREDLFPKDSDFFDNVILEDETQRMRWVDYDRYTRFNKNQNWVEMLTNVIKFKRIARGRWIELTDCRKDVFEEENFSFSSQDGDLCCSFEKKDLFYIFSQMDLFIRSDEWRNSEECRELIDKINQRRQKIQPFVEVKNNIIQSRLIRPLISA